VKQQNAFAASESIRPRADKKLLKRHKMNKSETPFKKGSRKTNMYEKNVMQVPIPEPHPERPPPNVPIPGEPSGGETGAFVCKKCGKTFNSKDELQVHMKMDH
jgi:hypothetical protein